MKDKKYILERSIKVARLTRLLAKFIDLFLVLLFSVVQYPLGLLLGIAYLCISDAIQNGQSVGKRFMGFFTVSLEDGKPCNYRQSIIRNLPLTIPLFFIIIPLWGWIISFLSGFFFIGLELFYLVRLDSGLRLGDVMADTTVIANHPNQVDLRKTEQTWFEPSPE